MARKRKKGTKILLASSSACCTSRKKTFVLNRLPDEGVRRLSRCVFNMAAVSTSLLFQPGQCIMYTGETFFYILHAVGKRNSDAPIIAKGGAGNGGYMPFVQ